MHASCSSVVIGEEFTEWNLNHLIKEPMTGESYSLYDGLGTKLNTTTMYTKKALILCVSLRINAF